ncbi:MAG: hypothetical protein A2219_04375 [Elusimicrobia bacterium RIFOXYA2_FULL_50_26]|nr:MAG: hypothetical protein A2219_04375 [Elusimicrobia bacterium RIFOXYA2_FULL_50_26]
MERVNKENKTLLLILAVAALSNFCEAAPVINSVSGIASAGNSLRISGAGFGSHGDYGGADEYLNYIFENCEAGKITRNPKWSVDGGGGWAKIHTGENRMGSNYNLFNENRATAETYVNAFGETVTTTYRYGIKTNVQNTAPVHKYFYSMWIMFSENFGLIQNTSDGTGIKITMNTPFDETGMKDYFSTGASTMLGAAHLSTNTESGELTSIAGPLSDFCPVRTWHRLDTFVSVPDDTTGFRDEVSWWVDGKHIRTAQQHGFTLQPDPVDVHKVGLISFTGYIYNGTDIPFYVITDDFYLDFTKARVELSDNPAWDETIQAHKEIQQPLSWSENYITINVNQGSFSNGQQAYLYIIDGDGTVNANGYPVRIGSDLTDSAPPDIPEGLSVY